MNNDKAGKGTPAPGWRGLWSRATSALARLSAMPEEDGTPGDAPGAQAEPALSDRFANQLFANLLLELPQHRQAFTSAWLAGDWQSLSDCAHQLAGATAYCDLPGLSAALAELRNAIRDGDELARQQTYNRAAREIDELLEKSGLRQS